MRKKKNADIERVRRIRSMLLDGVLESEIGESAELIARAKELPATTEQIALHAYGLYELSRELGDTRNAIESLKLYERWTRIVRTECMREIAGTRKEMLEALQAGMLSGRIIPQDASAIAAVSRYIKEIGEEESDDVTDVDVISDEEAERLISE